MSGSLLAAIHKRFAQRTLVIGGILFLMLIVVSATFLPPSNPLHGLEQFAQLIGALTGGILALAAINTPWSSEIEGEKWIGNERLGWNLVGCGLLCWGIGEGFWRYYLAHGQSPFPSLADAGYSLLPPLFFLGFLVQPSSFQSWQERFLTILDSLICMGAILAFAWYLLLGSLSLTLHEPSLAKILTLYYPTSDIGLLSCVFFLLLRGQGNEYQVTARRVSLLITGFGLCCFVYSDFVFNLQQNDGSYVNDSPYILGWVIGMLTIGLAAYLRRFLPATSENTINRRMQRALQTGGLSLVQAIPYILLVMLFLLLLLNVTNQSAIQIQLRPVLFIVTLLVVCLVIARQVVIQLDNANLARQQARAMQQLAEANQQVEAQAQLIAHRNFSLEQGIEYLKSVQARLANGNLRARATLTSGELLPLAASLNLMADRLARLEQADEYAEQLTAALTDVSSALERVQTGKPFVVKPSSKKFVIIRRLLMAMDVKEYTASPPTSSQVRQASPERRPFPSSTNNPFNKPPSRPNPQTPPPQTPIEQSSPFRPKSTPRTFP